jgi:hypothetical protein
LIVKGGRDYTIRYIDNDKEQINISDDEDFTTALEVAQEELNGNIKFIVEFRKAQTSIIKSEKDIKKEEKAKSKKEKKEKKDAKEPKKKKTLKKNKEEVKSLNTDELLKNV